MSNTRAARWLGQHPEVSAWLPIAACTLAMIWPTPHMLAVAIGAAVLLLLEQQRQLRALRRMLTERPSLPPVAIHGGIRIVQGSEADIAAAVQSAVEELLKGRDT